MSKYKNNKKKHHAGNKSIFRKCTENGFRQLIDLPTLLYQPIEFYEFITLFGY